MWTGNFIYAQKTASTMIHGQWLSINTGADAGSFDAPGDVSTGLYREPDSANCVVR